MPSRWDTVSVSGEPMRCYVGVPPGSPPFPAVIVIQHAGGVDDFIQRMAERFAAAGYLAAAPDLYHREDPGSSDDPMTRMGRLRDAGIVSDVNAAFEHVKRLPEARADRIGITGFCMGGRVAYLMAAHSPHLRAAVVFYGGNIMAPWGAGPAPFDLSDRIACPVMGLFGEDDPNPTPADVAKIDANLTRLGKAHDFHSYPGAGHAFMNAGRPSYREAAAADAWTRCLGWFQQYLSEE
ncbi:MAG: dienelactone hydrolase family protein [Dehalococcoidia bacterium]|nr:dienelactone hydrolase family protein [Dehalococcoidia bacterium]